MNGPLIKKTFFRLPGLRKKNNNFPVPKKTGVAVVRDPQIAIRPFFYMNKKITVYEYKKTITNMAIKQGEGYFFIFLRILRKTQNKNYVFFFTCKIKLPK